MNTFKPSRSGKGCQFYHPDYEIAFQRCVLAQGQGLEALNLPHTHIVFVRSGVVEVDYNQHKGVRARAGEMFFLPCSSDCYVLAVGPAEVLILGYDNHLEVCVKLMLEQLEPFVHSMQFEFRPLHICRALGSVLDAVEGYLRDDVDCAHLYEIKQLEISYIFRHYYSMTDKLMFFFPAIGKDVSFRNLVLSNYMKVRSAEDLAAACGYGNKNFHRIFQENFGMPPYRWMQQQWAFHIRGRLLDSRVPIKKIVVEYGFSSQSHLNAYCKRFLGATPVQIRSGGLQAEHYVER